ncbi:MAG: hybrid sensor histidine kinase/response regulator, partial [Candidatus Rokuibacteriota bacterium]
MTSLPKSPTGIESFDQVTGSVFNVRLPALADAPRRSEQAAPAPAGPCRRRILVVEDNADNREMMRLLLESSGHEVHEAGD